MIYSLYRAHTDEDGTWQWWTRWQPTDRVTGVTVVDGVGKTYIEVEHVRKVYSYHWRWRKWFWKLERLEHAQPYCTLYAPEHVRYMVTGKLFVDSDVVLVEDPSLGSHKENE
jgi:hypothetical protein